MPIDLETRRQRDRDRKRKRYAESPAKARDYKRQWRAANPEQWKAQLRARDHRAMARHRQAMKRIKDASGCVDCGGGDDLLFHHVDGGVTKSFDIANGWNRSASSLSIELTKCAVVCPACHAKRHAALAQ